MASPLSIYRFFSAELTPLLRAGLIGAVVLHVLALIVFSPGITVRSGPPAPETFLHASTLDMGEREQMTLLDSESLFLPTPLNYGYRGDNGEAVSEDIAEFGISLPELWVRPGLPLDLPKGAGFAVPDSRTALGLAHWSPAGTLGRLAQPRFALPARQAWLRVERVGGAGGAPVLEEAVSLGLGLIETDSLWRPVAFSCLIDYQGVVGVPVLVAAWEANASPGTGVAAVDAALKIFVESQPWATRLAPGRYRLVFSP